MAFVYSCCFWFSLRLGGILIGLISLFQGICILIVCCIARRQSQEVRQEITEWTNTLDLMYMNGIKENIITDPEKYASIGITICCIYIVICLLFIYGAYTCNNSLMLTFLVVEATRLVLLSVLVANFLLILKQNTMDIGLLIGASVLGGFLLLGMFYLWVCAVNLPVLINEMERDEQAATINKLQQLLEANNQRGFANAVDIVPFATDYASSRNMFVVSQNMPGKRHIIN